mmetsp:Transcript_12734/g.21326  ORF Transcript_12734/g.21326 Transcript_12734/m.21326 type:complete len:561 (+) Transcript_12734:2561-4243(+)
MHARVAEHYSNANYTGNTGNTGAIACSTKYAYGNVFLIGDAAHQFPPSGGFGMNTGMQDAHNLAWKLSYVLKGVADKQLLTKTYQQERKPIAIANTSLSLHNYGLSAATARALGLDPALASHLVRAATAIGGTTTTSAGEGAASTDSDKYNSAAWWVAPSWGLRRAAVLRALELGRSSLASLQNWESGKGGILAKLRVQALQSLVARGESLPLVFPKHDLEFTYDRGALVRSQDSVRISSSSSSNSTSNSSSGFSGTSLRVGRRIPHCWLELLAHPSADIDGQTTNVSINSTSPQQSQLSPSMQLDLQQHRKVVSTIHLPAIVEQAFSLHLAHSPPGASSSSSFSSSPSAGVALILLPEDVLSDMAAALMLLTEEMRSVFVCVAVKKYCGSAQDNRSAANDGDNGENCSGTQLDHSVLQRALQEPFYDGTMTDSIRVCDEMMKISAQVSAATVKDVASKLQERSSVRTLSVIDCSGRWSTIQQHNNAVVFLRPDGHIAHIFVLDDNKAECSTSTSTSTRTSISTSSSSSPSSLATTRVHELETALLDVADAMCMRNSRRS